MRSCYFFDMDSTLLEMNQDLFIDKYFKLIQTEIINNGYDLKEFMELFNKAVYCILKNDGKCTNEELFWNIMKTKYDYNKLNDLFNNFYNGSYLTLEGIVKKTNNPKEIISKLKNKGFRLVVATAPIFPRFAIETRLKWAGLNPSDFDIITDYSYSHYSKPKREYYNEILNTLNLKPEDCFMVGNDLDDDFIDLPEGFQKILITDNMLNRKNVEIKKSDFFLITTLEEFNKFI